MGFEDLEQKLEKFFLNESTAHDFAQKTRIKELTFARFSAKKESTWQKLSAFFFQKYVISAVSLAVIIGFMPVINNQIYAGEISRESGLVEVIRKGERIIVDGKSRLKIGDEIIVSGNANAKLKLKNNFESDLQKNSKVTVIGRDSLFLAQGKITNNFESGKISTNNGEISAKSLSHFSVDVAKSGETKIVPLKNSVFVQDWQGTEIELSYGEELRLRADTKLNSQKISENLKLSNAQIQAIQSKLFISRTKALNYVENVIERNYQQADEDFNSAKKSFKSIAQILKSSRDLKILNSRENIDIIDLNEIYKRAELKTNNINILSGIAVVEDLFEIIKNRENFDFQVPKTDSMIFNRYVLISRLFAGEKDFSRQKLGEILRKQYVVSFAQKIFNEELKIDQISILNEEIKKLPKSTMAKFFLLKVKEILPAELQNLLTEKIEKDF